MANTNLSVLVNNIVADATKATLPNQEIIDKVFSKSDSPVVVLVDNIEEFIPKYKKVLNSRMSKYINMGELDFFNEALGLADYVRTHHGYAYDHRDGAQKTEYPRDSKVLIVGDRDPVEIVDVVVDCSDMNVYQVETY